MSSNILSCMHRGPYCTIYNSIFSIYLPSRQTSRAPLVHTTLLNRARYSSLFAPLLSAVSLRDLLALFPINKGLRISARKSTSINSSASRRYLSAMATAASGSDDDYRSKAQQSPLASQRAKQANQPTESNRTGRFGGGYFPLGYKEGFNQWVCQLSEWLIAST